MIHRIVLIDIGDGMALDGVLPSAALLSPYFGSVTARGGSLPYTYTVTWGEAALNAAGIYLDRNTGEFTADSVVTPNALPITVRATDITGASVDRSWVINVIVYPGVLTLSGTFAAAKVGDPYDSFIIIAGGDGNYSLTGGTGLASGSFPDGLSPSIVGDELHLIGSATTDGLVNFVASVNDGSGQQATSYQSIDVTVIRGYEATVLADGPMGYWPMDDAAGQPMRDISGNGRDGEYTAVGATNQVDPLRDDGVGAFRLDEFTGGARVPNAGAVFNFYNTAFSVEIISKWAATGGVYGSLIENGTQGSRGDNAWRLIYRWGVSRVRMNYGGTQICVDSADASGVMHIVFTDDGAGTKTLYRNGVVVDAESLAALTTSSGSSWVVIGGGYSPGYQNNYGLKADVSDLAIYGRDLSASQVLAHAQAAGLA